MSAATNLGRAVSQAAWLQSVVSRHRVLLAAATSAGRPAYPAPAAPLRQSPNPGAERARARTGPNAFTQIAQRQQAHGKQMSADAEQEHQKRLNRRGPDFSDREFTGVGL